MALTSPSLTLAEVALWGNIKPTLDLLKKLGGTDFTKDAPTLTVKPGTTMKIPVSSITAASAYNESSNNYLTGGSTSWASLTATHYLQGFDITGTNVDQGVDAAKMKQLFTGRAGSGIAAAAMSATATALDATTTSTGVTIAAAGTADAAAYMGLGESVSWLDKATTTVAIKGAELAHLRAKFAAINVTGTLTELAQMMGFKDMVVVPGMTDRICLVPANSFGSLARVPALVADYKESGTFTDEDSGLSIGVVIASDQATNKLVANADLWFGVATQSANAGATTAGIINVGTTASTAG